MIKNKRTWMILFLLGILSPLFAQQIPTDKDVRIGKLENGLTYYIRKNDLPKDRADFRLVVRAGALQEDDNQDGLAHFCEHIAFNGTKHFPDKGIINFLESIGVAFGHHINAYTTQEETVYMLKSVPTTQPENVDSAMLILSDWAGHVSYLDEEIEKERGVIHEEWRTRRSAARRMYDENSKEIYKGSKYAVRNVIGDINIIDNAEPKLLRKFYNDWYRPDLQAVIVVGDIDVDKIEAQIKEKFSGQKMPEVVRERELYSIPDNDDVIVAIATDKEARNVGISYQVKHDIVTTKDEKYLRNEILQHIYFSMLNDRLSELTQKENPPYITGYAAYGATTETKDVFYSYILPNSDNPTAGFKALLTEIQRVKQHGFTASELERAKTKDLRDAEKEYKESEKTKSGSYLERYMRHFVSGEPIPDDAYIYEFRKKQIPTITLDELNAQTKEWLTEKNQVVSVTGPDKEGVLIPSKEDILGIIKEVQAITTTPYTDKATNQKLLAKEPKAGKIVREEKNSELGTTTWELSNGVKVILKPTDFKKDEIQLSAHSYGGSSLFPENYAPSAQMTDFIVNMSGLGEFDNITLTKMLAGKIANVSPWVGELDEGFSGKASPQDFELMMQMVYLYFTNPRKDEVAFKANMSRYKAYLQNKSLDPRSVFNDSVTVTLSNHHPRRAPFNVDLLNKVELDKVYEIYNRLFQNAGNFTFVLTGNLDMEQTRQLAEKYLASLPSTGQKESWKDPEIEGFKGNVVKTYPMKMKTPLCRVRIDMQDKAKYSAQNQVLFDALSYILRMRYIETIREEQGGSYGVAVRTNLKQFPKEAFSLFLQFDCDPEKAEMLTKIAYEEIEKICKNGPSQVDVDKTKEYFLKQREEALKENSFWKSLLMKKETTGIDMISPGVYEELVNNISIKSVKKLAAKHLNTKNVAQLKMVPLKE